MAYEFKDFFDIEDYKKVYNQCKLQFTLIILLYLGAFMELSQGKHFAYLLLLDDTMADWESYLVMANLVLTRYTAIMAVIAGDPFFSTIAEMMGFWYTYRVMLAQALHPLFWTVVVSFATIALGAREVKKLILLQVYGPQREKQKAGWDDPDQILMKKKGKDGK